MSRPRRSPERWDSVTADGLIRLICSDDRILADSVLDLGDPNAASPGFGFWAKFGLTVPTFKIDPVCFVNGWAPLCLAYTASRTPLIGPPGAAASPH